MNPIYHVTTTRAGRKGWLSKAGTLVADDHQIEERATFASIEEAVQAAANAPDVASLPFLVSEVSEVDRLALRFVEVLISALHDLLDKGESVDISDVREENARRRDGSCSSHDHLDANDCMIEAFAAVMGRECLISEQEDADLVNAAWDRALQHYPEDDHVPAMLGDAEREDA